MVKEGARAREFEEAVEWLVSAGMVNRIYNVSQPEHPLPVFDRLDAFKLFLMDTGLLKHMAGIDNSAILLKADYQFKGALTENYVLQQLKGQFSVEPRYYSTPREEIDFIVQHGMEKRNPTHAVRLSKREYRKDSAITNIPLYLAGKLPVFLD